MTLRVPPPPDDLLWVALTVYQEAGGEPWEGQLGIAHVIVSRARRTHLSLPDVVLARLQFSAWNENSPTRMRLDTAGGDAAWQSAYRAAAAAVLDLAPDPTGGADHYLNPEATRASRKDGTLPVWAARPDDRSQVNEALVTTRIGQHVFMKLMT